MKKIVLIGPAGSGKTTLANNLIKGGKFEEHRFIHETSSIFNVEFSLKWNDSICFDAIHDTDIIKIIKRTLSRSHNNYLRTIVCCWQERPEWLTKEFCKDNHILVFELNKIRL